MVATVVAVVFLALSVLVLILIVRQKNPSLLLEGDTLVFGSQRIKTNEIVRIYADLVNGPWNDNGGAMMIFLEAGDGRRFSMRESYYRGWFTIDEEKTSKTKEILQAVAAASPNVEVDSYVGAILAGKSVRGLSGLYYSFVTKDVLKTVLGIVIFVAVLGCIYLVLLMFGIRQPGFPY